MENNFFRNLFIEDDGADDGRLILCVYILSGDVYSKVV
jgi:hypothetical protein